MKITKHRIINLQYPRCPQPLTRNSSIHHSNLDSTCHPHNFTRTRIHLQSHLDTSLSPSFHMQQNSQSLRSQYSVSSPAFRTPLHQLMYNDHHVADSESQPASTNNVVIEPPAQNENASGKSKKQIKKKSLMMTNNGVRMESKS